MSESVKKNLVVVGDSTAGKTCLLTVFSTGVFPVDYIPTVYDITTSTITVNDRNVALTLVDTAGHEGYDRLRPISYQNSDVVLVCFSIGEPDTLKNVEEKWAPEVKHFRPTAVTILVGNKKDLRNDPKTIAELSKVHKRPVSSEEGRAMAKKINANCYMECSSLNNDGVKQVFETAVRSTLNSKPTVKKRGCFLL